MAGFDPMKKMGRMLNAAKQNAQMRGDNRGDGSRGKGGGRPFVEKGQMSELGCEFYNPYTFIPFPTNIERKADVSYLTVDEYDKEQRFTGVLDLVVKNISPLLSCESEPRNYKVGEDGRKIEGGHKEYNALTIGDDFIVPATSVRGSLRTLMTILCGSTLGYMDRHLYLCQGRDVHCGPIQGYENRKAFVALVVEPGSFNSDGKIELGESGIFDSSNLMRLAKKENIKLPRPTTGFNRVFVDNPKNPCRIEVINDVKEMSTLPYQIKLAGFMNVKGVKKEGYFRSLGNTPIFLPASFWEAYKARNKNGDHKRLEKGDLIWIEPKNPDASAITSANDIKSIQWARWGKNGQSFEEVLGRSACVKPDCMNPDGKIDAVTDMWGQVYFDSDVACKTFASRIRVHNLVFENEKKLLREETLAPLAQPHPGCIAMYRNDSPEKIGKTSPLNGYKVYRNTKNLDEKAPWLYANQGVYDNGMLKPQKSNMNKTVQLLTKGQLGHLKISFRGLSKKELALLLLTCSVDWKLGGGKPLGLGHCRVVEMECRDEFGCEIFPKVKAESENVLIPDAFAPYISDSNLQKRVLLYKKSQEPVAMLRYPRAVEGKRDSDNKLGVRREALVWFSRFTKVKTDGCGNVNGLTSSILNEKEYPGMVLGNIESYDGPLYGYDLYMESQGGGLKNMYKAEPYDSVKHKADPKNKNRENNSQNRYTRRDDRSRRGF